MTAVLGFAIILWISLGLLSRLAYSGLTKFILNSQPCFAEAPCAWLWKL